MKKVLIISEVHFNDWPLQIGCFDYEPDTHSTPGYCRINDKGIDELYDAIPFDVVRDVVPLAVQVNQVGDDISDGLSPAVLPVSGRFDVAIDPAVLFAYVAKGRTEHTGNLNTWEGESQLPDLMWAAETIMSQEHDCPMTFYKESFILVEVNI